MGKAKKDDKSKSNKNKRKKGDSSDASDDEDDSDHSANVKPVKKRARKHIKADDDDDNIKDFTSSPPKASSGKAKAKTKDKQPGTKNTACSTHAISLLASFLVIAKKGETSTKKGETKDATKPKVKRGKKGQTPEPIPDQGTRLH